MADIGDGVQVLPKEKQTVVKNNECDCHSGCKNYDNGLFYIQDRDAYHQKFKNCVNLVSMCDNYVPDHNFVNVNLIVGQVETNIVYNTDINQFQDGCQYSHTCEQYLVQFTNRQFIDYHRRGSVFLVFKLTNPRVKLFQVGVVC